MKTSLLLLLALGLVANIGPAQTLTASPDRQSLKINQTVTPVFPRKLQELGYVDGEARIEVAVDETGKLIDWLVVGYTHRGFADESVNAIKQWKFEPARERGNPIAVRIELCISFEASGVVISSGGVNSAVDRYLNRLTQYRDAYQPCTMKELDRIPTLQNAVNPAYSEALAKQGVQGNVTIGFFIDETGALRMPAVLSADYDELASLALAAVQQWKFEPPTRHGRPVLVRAKQVFHFGPKKS